MTHSLTMLTVHLTWSTKYRQPHIVAPFDKQLHEYIGGVAKHMGAIAHAVGGVEDHVHALVSYPGRISVSDIARVLKTNSSKRVNENSFCNGVFAWQTGYGAFSIHTSQIEEVAHYIRTQKEHHKDHLLEHETEFIRNKLHIRQSRAKPIQ